jgi:bifunctional oligoribonuclease and PAP phosphatase NrnA
MLTEIASRLKQHSHPLLIAHPRPDGDTIGSTLALRLALIALGKSPTVACVHPLPSSLAYLPGADTFVEAVPEEAVARAANRPDGAGTIDLVVAIDMSDLSRTGGIYKMGWQGRIPLIVIDHHETNEAFGDLNFVHPHAAATALMMREVIEALGVPVRDEIATCLLVGILTDTRGLRTETTTPEVLRTVAELIEAGGDYLGVMQQTLDSVPYKKMRSWGRALDQLQLKGEIAWTTFRLVDKAALNVSDHDDLDLGNLLSRVAEAKVIAAFIEMRDGTVKVSMRARPGYNVASIAHALGGGGHRQAAGCTIDGPLDAAVTQVLNQIAAILHS